MNRSGRLPRRAAAAVWSLAVGAPIGLVALVLVSPTPDKDAWAIPLYSTIVATWGLTGAFLVTRRPDNRVGWVLFAAGSCMGIALLAQLWAFLSLEAYGGSLPGTLAGATVGLLFVPALFLTMLVPLLFPDGSLMSRRWAAVVALLISSAVATLVGVAIRPGPVEGMPEFDNPFGVPALAELSRLLVEFGGIGALLCMPAGIVAAILRYRRGDKVERAQMRWFGSVFVLALSMFGAATLLPQPYGQWAWIVASLSLGLIPVAIGIAILRYRLYEIDRIVGRTIAYGVVSAILGALFVGIILAMQALLAPFTKEQTIAVAVSTLAVFALFQPLRRRVQATVDRRFDRSRYDADLTVRTFAARLRGDLDLSTVRGEIVGTATSAVRPTTAGVWIRKGGR
jgi:hypothetical protein